MKPKRRAGDDRLPPEIWTEVLVRVPVKSILRCRSVCKSWYSLVSCPNFISYYSSKTLNKNRLLLQLFNTGTKVTSFRSLDESFMESRKHDEFRKHDELHDIDIEIVGSCDGLICLYKYYMYRPIPFFLWNPTIRKLVELPSQNHGGSISYIGFGFDSNTSDYKIMCATNDVCEIFDLRKGVWRSISPPIPPWRVKSICSECYLDGAVHWCTRKHPEHTNMILLSFSLSDECFRDIKMLDLFEMLMVIASEERVSITSTRSVTFDGLIYVIARNSMQGCLVWVMREYGVAESWTKVSHIKFDGSQTWPHRSLLWKNSELLMTGWDNDLQVKENLVLYNKERGKFERVFSFNKTIREMCIYEETLVLM